MLRAVKVSLGFATQAKLGRLLALRREIQSCTQAHIDAIWTSGGGLDSATLNRVTGGSLSYRHRSNCLKVALETVSATRKASRATGVPASKPTFRGAVRLSSLVAKVEKGKGTFDWALKVSGLSKGNPIVIPFKGHARLNHWLAKPGAKILGGCTLGDGWAALWIDIPVAPLKEGSALGVDIGINKLIVDSNGTRYGTDMRAVMARVRRCKPGSNGKRRARRARENYINREVKRLPWDHIGTIGVERLKNLKRGKRPGRSKQFRKAVAPWTYRQAVARIEMLAEENRVRLIAVDPRNTSRTCPRCGTCAAENRRGESFRCTGPNCDNSADADLVGALNVLARTRVYSQESMVPALPCGRKVVI
ncbi:MAG: RNA-guided endonuclease InsQ/TnpB family protein [Polyangiales bacterium]